MSEDARYHRLGRADGPGCPVTTLEIQVKVADGAFIPARLLDAGTAATEIELLRTVARMTGIHWGQDDLGWWAVVPSTTV